MATSLSSALTRFYDRCGRPLVGGKVFTYEVGTTTFKPTYTDSQKNSVNTNPVILDSMGQARIFLDGAYRVRVFDCKDVLVEEIDYIESWMSSSENEKIYEAIDDAYNRAVSKIYYDNQMWQGALSAWQMGHALSVDPLQRRQIPVGITHARTGFGSGTTIFHVNGTYEQDAMRIQRTAGNTSTSDHNFVINFSFDEAKHLFGNKCCLAWHMFKGADYAASSVNVKILGSEELEQPILRSDGIYSNGNVVISSQDFTIEARSKDNPFSLVFDLPFNFTQIAVLFTIKFTNATALADDYLEFEGLQVTQSDGYVKTLKLQKNDVLEKAMTRYQTTYPYGAPRGVNTEQGSIQMIAVNSNVNWAFSENIKFNPPMLIPPQFMFQAPTSSQESRFLDKDSASTVTGLAFNLSESGVSVTTNSGSIVAGHRYLCHWTAQIIF
ncbi:hypothetical protein [Acinetobacter sp. Ac_5812]|uniref:hypothetical protein n=1 Tax=Acinetobacter sp. Ac_5812 TaxID=1848937 RepID=UPI0014902899|nr:hypothetical protein [Acinetobacter sp. Ac_5812]NNP70921.1 hypothetical protein [Acinetobacter sp. Ac_5812]